jgi:obg-like ATPase 1
MSRQGASTGAGLGNAFLSHVRAVDGIFQVVRAFDDAEVIHVEGDVNPLRDMEIIQTELRLKDIEWVQRRVEDMKKTTRSLGATTLADKAKKEELVCCRRLSHSYIITDTMCFQVTTEKILKTLSEDGKDVRKVDWTNKEVSV